LTPSDETSASRRRTRPDQIAGVVTVLLGVYVGFASREYPFGTIAEPGPGFLPLVLAIVLSAFGLVLTISASLIPSERRISFEEFPHAVVILAALGAAALAIERMGYRITIGVMVLVFLALIERRNVIGALSIATVMALGSFYLINNVLRVPLPLGPWGI
jgi:ethanolamine transporter EutH